MNEKAVEQLADTLLAQIKSSLDKRDTDLCERMSKQLDEKAQELRREQEKRAAHFAVPGLSVNDKETKTFDFGRLLKGLMHGDVQRHAPLEYEMCREAERAGGPITKDMTSTIDSLGGFIVPNQVMAAQIIPLLQPSVVAFEAGVTRMSGLNGSPVQIPKITGATTAYWLGETEAPTTSDINFGQIDLFPHDVFAICTLSNRLIELSAPGAEQIVRQQLATDIALKIDAAVFNGSGALGQPLGILQTTGINTVATFGAPGAAAAYDKLIDMEHALFAANAQSMGEFVWAMHPTVFREIRQMLDPTDNSQPKERRMLAEGKPTTLLGHRYVLSTQLPGASGSTNSFLLGAFSAAMVGEWGTMVLAASREGTNFTKRQTQILAGMTVDVGVRQPTAFCAATGVTLP
jgi:HK97 family phage major capsid protein